MSILTNCCQNAAGRIKAGFQIALKNQSRRQLIILYGVTFLVILPIVGQAFKFSIYYARPDKARSSDLMRKENTRRYGEAARYIKMLNETKLHHTLGHALHDTTRVDVAISVITVSRNRHSVDNYEPRYLTQVVWRLLYLLHAAQAEGYSLHVHVAICNVDGDAEHYNEAQLLTDLVPVYTRFKKLFLTLENQVEKEKQDYIYCMNESLTHNPRYVLLIEDDALPNDDFFQVLEHFIHTRLDNHYVGGSLVPNPNPGLYVKLYHPERLLGFISLESDRISQLISIGLFCGTICTSIYWRYFMSSNTALYRIWFCFVLYFILASLAIGRAHLIDLKRFLSPHFYNLVDAPECCTPAMLFPKKGAIRIIEHLSTVKCKWKFGKDTALWTWQRSQGMPAFMIQPNLVSHIGMYSALRKAILDPFIV